MLQVNITDEIGFRREILPERIVYVQKGVEQNWAGWDASRLIGFIVVNAKLNVSSAKTKAL